MTNTNSKTLIVTGLLSSILLAGCSNSTSTNNTTGAVDTGSTQTGAVKAQKVLTSEKVSYKTPSDEGGESIKVTITTENDLIVDFAFETEGSNPISQKWQTAFKEGVASQLIGKPTQGLNVGIVNGASLTSAAFNEAVSKLQG